MGAKESLSALLELRINERQGKIRPSLFFFFFFSSSLSDRKNELTRETVSAQKTSHTNTARKA